MAECGLDISTKDFESSKEIIQNLAAGFGHLGILTIIVLHAEAITIVTPFEWFVAIATGVCYFIALLASVSFETRERKV